MAAVASNKRKRDVQDIQAIRAPPAINAAQDFSGYLQSHHEMDNEDSNMDFASMLVQQDTEHDTAEESQAQPADQSQPAAQQQQRPVNGGQSASDTATAALAQYHTMTVPQPTERSFLAQHGDRSDHRGSIDQGSTTGAHRSSFGDYDSVKEPQSAVTNDGESSPGNNPTSSSSTSAKPVVGSDEWHKVRRDNHKEVERRRRETINEGINELAKIVPGCEKNKGQILARAVQFITQLKDNESQNIEKWTLEKLLTEQTIGELSSCCDKLKAECQRAWAECEQWKRAAQKSGVTLDKDEKVVAGADGNDDDAE